MLGAQGRMGEEAEAAEAAGEAFASKVGLAKASADQLRALTPETILKAGDPDMAMGGGSIADGKILTMSAAQGFAKGLEAKVPYIVGSNSLEFPVAAPAVEARLARSGNMQGAARERVTAAYPSKDEFTLRIVSDLTFTEPALNMARLHASRGQKTYVYRFSVLPPTAPAALKGAPHASERQYVFRTLNASTWPTTPNDAAQAALMSAYWVSFAKTGDPNGGGRPAWPAYDPAKDLLLDFTNAGPVVKVTPDRKVLDAIAATYAK
jgi:para-nitrobenzyl esterase